MHTNAGVAINVAEQLLKALTCRFSRVELFPEPGLTCRLARSASLAVRWLPAALRAEADRAFGALPQHTRAAGALPPMAEAIILTAEDVQRAVYRWVGLRCSAGANGS